MKEKYEGFNLQMALVDALPVLMFVVAFGIVAFRFPNILFILGVIFSSLAGFLKVLWKIIIALKKKDIYFFYAQFKYLMSIGFILMILSLFLLTPSVDFPSLWNSLIKLPSLIFFILGFILMGVMFVLAFKLDKNDAKSNWIEQGVNTLAQFMFLLGIIFCA